MKFMTNYKFGEVVLVAFPFTDLMQTKKRPALVFFDSQDNDIVICRISSQMCNTNYDIEMLNWKESGLLLPSFIRLHKIATIHKNKIDKTIGKLTKNDLTNVKQTIKNIIQKI